MYASLIYGVLPFDFFAYLEFENNALDVPAVCHAIIPECVIMMI